MREFVFAGQSSRVRFGAGALSQLREEVELLGCSRALVIDTPGRVEQADRAREVLGPRGVARFDLDTAHPPADVTRRALAAAREHAADCVVALGGRSVIGSAGEIAEGAGLPLVAVPTSYAGAEAVPAAAVGSAVYDADLTLTLPVPVSVAGGVSAMAHAIEAMYAPQANPVIDELALKAIELMAGALPGIVADPAARRARSDALQAVWLASGCLHTVGAAGLHHALCDTLRDSFGLPHAETHAAVLPHVMAFNAPAVPDVMRRVARALGTADAPTAVHDLVRALYGPLSLRQLGLPEGALAYVARTVAAARPGNPRELTQDGVAALLRQAWSGDRPASVHPLGDQLRSLTRQVTASFAAAPDARLRTLLTDLVTRLHGFVADNDLTQDEWRHAVDFLTRAGHITDDSRQEFILLSDTLGISSAVDVLANSRTPGSTPSAVLGPFYVAGPPPREHGADLGEGLPGTPLYVRVGITDLDGTPLPGAVADVWQSDDDGFYDVQLPEVDGPVLRARFHADADGRIAFRSILPSEYPIPADGPVGEMLRSVGRHPYRAPHLHFLITAPGREPLITQLFVAGGAYLDSDAVFGVKDALVVDFPRHDGPAPDGRPVEGPWRSLDYTFRLAPAPQD